MYIYIYICTKIYIYIYICCAAASLETMRHSLSSTPPLSDPSDEKGGRELRKRRSLDTCRIFENEKLCFLESGVCLWEFDDDVPGRT